MRFVCRLMAEIVSDVLVCRVHLYSRIGREGYLRYGGRQVSGGFKRV